MDLSGHRAQGPSAAFEWGLDRSSVEARPQLLSEKYGVTPAVDANRTRSTTERVPSFLATRPRCTLIVFSTTCSSNAICLFNRPAMTSRRTKKSVSYDVNNHA